MKYYERDAQAYADLANALRRMGDLEGAWKSAQKAAELRGGGA